MTLITPSHRNSNSNSNPFCLLPSVAAPPGARGVSLRAGRSTIPTEFQDRAAESLPPHPRLHGRGAGEKKKAFVGSRQLPLSGSGRGGSSLPAPGAVESTECCSGQFL